MVTMRIAPIKVYYYYYYYYYYTGTQKERNTRASLTGCQLALCLVLALPSLRGGLRVARCRCTPVICLLLSFL